MTNLVPEKWKEALEGVHDRIGHVLTRISPRKKQELLPEGITVDAIPAFMQSGGPLLDMSENSDELVIRVEVPGLKKDDFSVELMGTRLTIRGEKKVQREQKGMDGRLISECSYGSFARSIELPYEIDEKTIAADLNQGVLTIRLLKTEKARHVRHRVPIS